MIQSFNNNQDDCLRRQSRMQKEKVFTLSDEQYNNFLGYLSGDDNESLNIAMEQFARHYKYNKFQYNDQTHIILTVAVSAINSIDNEPTDLAQNSFDLLSSAINNASNGLSFVIQTSALDVLENNINNIHSPFFDQAVISLSQLVSQTPSICKTINENFPITFFFNIIENYDTDKNPDVPFYILYILYYYAKYKCLDDEQSFQIIEFLGNILDNFYKHIKNQSHIEFTDIDIYRNCVKVLARIFENSAISHDTKFTSNLIIIFNQILQLDIRSSNVKKLVSAVLQAFIPLLKSGSALKEPGIDIVRIASLIKKSYTSIQPVALECIIWFIPSNDTSIKILFHTRMLHYLKKIIESGTYNAKKKTLVIYDLIMRNGTDEEKVALLMFWPELIFHLVSLAKEIDDDLYLQIINLLDLMLKLETNLGQDLHIHSIFSDSGGIQMIEENIIYGSDTNSEASQQFKNEHFGEGE